jgi:hypothetical protein
LALFNLGIDSKLRACDLVKLRVRDVANGERASARASVIQQKTGRPVQFELTEPIREAAVQRPGTIFQKAQAFDFSTADDYLDKTIDCGLAPAATVGVAIRLKAPVLASMM